MNEPNAMIDEIIAVSAACNLGALHAIYDAEFLFSADKAYTLIAACETRHRQAIHQAIAQGLPKHWSLEFRDKDFN